MKRLKILQTQSDFETQYPDGIPSNDVVLVREHNKLYIATNNTDGQFTEYTGGTIDSSTIEDLGLVTLNDISTLVSVNDASVYAKLGTTNMGNMIIGSNTSTAGYSYTSRRLYNGHESLSRFANTDNRTAILNKVGSVENARIILDHNGLELDYSGDISTNFTEHRKHVALIEDTSANFALKSELTGLVDSNDISAFLKQNDVSTYAMKSDLDYIVWQGT
jgi:hypothetical protein